MNRWNIPNRLEEEIRSRDQACVYCGTDFAGGESNLGRRATWEHIVNDVRIVNRENIARCCASCNSSKGSKPVAVWFESPYCKVRGISRDSVADVVRRALENPTSLDE
jgi:hypothetical protein